MEVQGQRKEEKTGQKGLIEMKFVLFFGPSSSDIHVLLFGPLITGQASLCCLCVCDMDMVHNYVN